MARLPPDLENIMREAIEMGPKDMDAIEDCVNKIEMYRKLFGCHNGQPQTQFREFVAVDKMIKETFDKREVKQAQVVEETPKPKASSKNVGFTPQPAQPAEDDGFSTVTKRQKKQVGL